MLKAVIFDLDGTLVDCDLELAKRVVAETLAHLTGKPFAAVRKILEQIHYRCNVESLYDRNRWWDFVDPHLSLEEKQHLTDLYWKCVIETTYVKPYVSCLLETLKEKDLTLVLLTDYDGESSSKRQRVEGLPLVSFFDFIVIAGEDTAETKPSLEPYQHILERLQADPEDVLMVGDKPEVDLAGALALGMKTLLLEGDYGNEWEPAVKDLRGVLAYIEELVSE